MHLSRIASLTLSTGLVALSACTNTQRIPGSDMPPEVIVEEAVLSAPLEAERTPESFDALLRQLRADPALADDLDPLKTHRASPEGIAARGRLDKLAGQKDAWVSGLFWYTDIEKAKAAAQGLGLPIVSLRLLGRLDDEFC